MTQTFTVDDNGKTFTVSRGEVMMIKPDENLTTGFQWVPSVSPGISITGDLYKTSDNNRFASGKSMREGAGGVSGPGRLK
jgi:predicted secreted protein